MKKNLLMASLVAVFLVGVLTVINRVSAATANITLSVTAGTFTCSAYPTAVSLGSTGTATSSVNLITDAWTSGFTCTDLASTWATQMVAQSTPLTGATTGVIPAANISWIPTGTITTTAGDCGGLTLGAGGALDTSKTIIQKSGIKTCSFTYAPDGMSVTVPAYSPVNAYTAIMTITNPA